MAHEPPQLSKPEITALLLQWRGGDQAAIDRLMPIVYAELGRMAARYIRKERALNSLQPTALVHEAYLRLVEVREANWQDRTHFFGAVANIMRRVLVDLARTRMARKRDPQAIRVSLSEVDTAVAAAGGPDLEVWELDQALTELSRLDPELGRLVELRYFGGLSVDETAEVLRQSPATVKRHWQVAKGWLHQRITNGPGAEAGR
jgi:RNA polymerase sigma factor (TIGR02999 family)